MPSRYSQEATRGRPRQRSPTSSASRLQTIPIDEAFERELEATRRRCSGGEQPTELTRQNVQARLRGQRMWNWANSSGALFLQTGNMSEKAVGYTTIGGDLEGALAVIANVPKTVVIALLDHLHDALRLRGHRRDAGTPARAGARRRPGGRERADAVPGARRLLHLYAGEKMSPDEVGVALRSAVPRAIRPTSSTPGRTRFARLFTQSIYKWVQSPLSLHVGILDLDRERALQLPVVQRTEWQDR